MSAPAGYIELERTVESIHVGRRHRTELGDIDELAASIDREGLLQPITITPEGVLVCGARRLAAIKKLSWRKVNVWVRSGVSDRLGHLLAEQDDNALHKPLTQTEAAGLYRELKALMAEDAARREQATRFSSDNQPGADGRAKFAPPSLGPTGRTREQAAAMIPGGASHTTLEKIGYLQKIAEDPAQPAELRAQVSTELERIDGGAAVHPIFEAIRDAAETARDDREADLHRLATDALARAKQMKTAKRTPRPRQVTDDDGEPARYPVRAFVLTWGELVDWWTHYDVEHLAAELTDEQIASFLTTAEGTSKFAEELRAACEELTDDGEPDLARPHLRAL
ncbi:ParB N-terminal domain-containing protein [Brevibacterium casei]|uniref:Chromosome partitioning protein, ParB family n=2 Tax=Brevibacterium casei TaxID=33889 RepID=A0A2H1K2W6_9MICO|nr:ParB N-terminal domain-containing protein [Brevibacterium casei]MCT1549013.1 ParB N-terminal domain-containing protein [Brevibacterium casei]MCT1558920.1 ParB N-terminal domain-containing protein [Brevibacterium casei]MCT2207223.1 ParB N-terminal domain-containing protein [Brevibacterium casei]QPR38081.1 ParB N-terminal domain-containing protein [Brevibacterium casei]QPR45370.1 ParB N-terminal domain-containing protein [Brevibacterium casei]